MSCLWDGKAGFFEPGSRVTEQTLVASTQISGREEKQEANCQVAFQQKILRRKTIFASHYVVENIKSGSLRDATARDNLYIQSPNDISAGGEKFSFTYSIGCTTN